MAVIEIPLSNQDPAFRFVITLDNSTYRFVFRWNGRIAVWVFDIFDSLNNPIQTGNPFITGFEFLRQNTRTNKPPGKLLAINTEIDNANATRFNIGGSVKFLYVEAE